MAKDDKIGKEPYGDVEYADPGYQKDGKKRYPIDTAEHIRAAWNYINHPDNADLYEAGHLKSIKARIVAAWKQTIDEAGPAAAKDNAFVYADDLGRLWAPARIRAKDQRDYKAATPGVTFRVGRLSPDYFAGPYGSNMEGLLKPQVDTNQMSIYSIKFDADKFGFGDVLDWTKENNFWIGRFTVNDKGIELFVGPSPEYFEQDTLTDIPSTATKRNCADGTVRAYASKDGDFKTCGDCSNKNRCAKMGDCFLDAADNHQLATMLAALISRASRLRAAAILGQDVVDDDADTDPDADDQNKATKTKKKKPPVSDDTDDPTAMAAAAELLAYADPAGALSAGAVKTYDAMGELHFASVGDIRIFRDTKATAKDIKGVEIFKAGKWNGDDYSVKDLDAMIEAFKDVGYQPPIKLGHDGTDGDRAWGWVSNIYRKGDTLYADFADVPSSLYDIIADHGYDHVSAEIYWDLERGDKKFSRALKAVALLGAATPAVADLAPLRTCLSIDPGAAAKVKTHTFSAKETKMTKKTIAELSADARSLRVKLGAAQDEARSLSAKIAGGDKTLGDRAAAVKTSIDDLNRQIDEADAAREVAFAEQEKTLASMQTQMTGLIENNARMLDQQRVDRVSASAKACRVPAMKPLFAGLYDVLSQSTERKYALKTTKDGKEVTTELTGVELVDSIRDHVNKLFATTTVTTHAARGVQPSDEQDGDADHGDDGDDIGRPDIEVTDKAKVLMDKDPNLKFAQATAKVLSADADLRSRYARFTTPGGVR